MNQKFFQLKSFLNYWLDAVDAHSLQSPFFFDLYHHVVRKIQKESRLTLIESLRHGLENNDKLIEVDDLGSGSASFKGSIRKVSVVAKTSLSPWKYSVLYRQLILYINAIEVIELGTSLGITSLYLAYDMPSKVYTFEGSASIANVARNQFDQAACSNITLVRGNIDKTLPELLMTLNRVDFVLMDANHRYEPTMRYFQLLVGKAHSKTVIAMDDIHYSAEMENAWNEIRRHPRVCASADLFRCGLLFFDQSLSRQHFVLKF